MVLIIFSFILQELASVNAVLLKAYHDGRSLWLIHLLFICATAFDIWAGYEIGKLSQSKFPDSRFVKFVRKWTSRAENYIGHHGKKVSLLFLGFINFPYINGFAASLTTISFAEAFLFILLGDLMWYVGEWLLIFGVKTFAHDFYLSIYITIGISLIIVLILRMVFKKSYYTKI